MLSLFHEFVVLKEIEPRWTVVEGGATLGYSDIYQRSMKPSIWLSKDKSQFDVFSIENHIWVFDKPPKYLFQNSFVKIPLSIEIKRDFYMTK